MRDLHSELRAFGFLTNSNCYDILDWVNTLTKDDLISNGNLNMTDPITEYLDKNRDTFSKIKLTSNIAQQFGLPLSEAHQKVCDYFNK